MSEDTKEIRLDEPVNIEADKHFLEEVYAKRSYVRDELRIVLIGKTGSGKSATGNTIAGAKVFQSEANASSITSQCGHVTLKRFNRDISVVDTPGLFDTGTSEAKVGEEIKRCVLLTSPGMHAIILVTRVGRFTEEEKKTVAYFKQMFGDGLTNYLMIVFTGKDDLDEDDKTIEDFIKSAPSDLQQLIAESGDKYMVLNNRGSKEVKDNFTQNLIAGIERMVKANGGKCYTTTMFRKAEAIMKKREEEEKRKIEEEKKKEIEAIQKGIKEKYDKLIQQQDVKMNNVNMELKNLKEMGKKDEKLHQMEKEQFGSQLKQLQKDREKADEERKSQEKYYKKSLEDMNKVVEEMGRKQARDNVESAKRVYRSLHCRGLSLNQHTGELSYNSTMPGSYMPVAQCIGPKPISETRPMFSIELIKPMVKSEIGIGLCDKRYDHGQYPGWKKNSIGYHADDGGIFHENGQPDIVTGVLRKGEVMGCSFDFSESRVTFLRNGNKVYTSQPLFIPPGGFYPIVSLEENGQVVRLLEREPWTV